MYVVEDLSVHSKSLAFYTALCLYVKLFNSLSNWQKTTHTTQAMTRILDKQLQILTMSFRDGQHPHSIIVQSDKHWPRQQLFEW